MSAVARRLLRPEAGFFAAVLVAVLALFREKAFADPGALWHVRVGDLILADGFPRTDPFTYTFAGSPWIPQQWGAEVVMSLLHRATGFDGLLLGLAAGVAALFTWQFARLRQAGMGVPLAAAACAGCLFVGSFHYYARPHMWTVAGLGLTVAWLVDVDRGRRPVGFLLWLVPVFIVWTNLHGGVLGGLMTLGLAVAGWLTTAAREGWRNAPVRSRRLAALAVGVVAACGLTPLVNPFGLELLDTWRRIVGSGVLKEAVSEHKPLALANPADRLVVVLAAGYLVVLAGAWPALRVTWLLPLVWLAYTVTSIRQGPLFAVAAGFVLPDVWPHTVWHRLLVRYGDSLAVPPAGPGPRSAWVLPAAAVLGVAGLQLADVRVPVVGRGWARPSEADAPPAFLPAVRAFAATTGTAGHVYNDANFGGYLIYHAPGLKIFMDDRFEQYGEQWTRDYVDAIWRCPERFDAWDARWRFGLALVATDAAPTPLDRLLTGRPGEWAEAARAPTAVLFRRVAPPRDAHAAHVPGHQQLLQGPAVP